MLLIVENFMRITVILHGDIDLLVKIVLAIFMECSLISPYDNYCQEVAWTKNQLLEKIKKDVRWQFDNES